MNNRRGFMASVAAAIAWLLADKTPISTAITCDGSGDCVYIDGRKSAWHGFTLTEWHGITVVHEGRVWWIPK